MPPSPAKRIDELMEQASRALAETDYFEAERRSIRALALAREATDFDRMARIVLPLQEARRQRLQQALDVGTVTIIDTPLPEETIVESGCYVVRPPRVGADARRLRLAALEAKVPVAFVCREPTTQLGMCPIVAIGPGTTIRTMVDPADDPDAIDLAWFVGAMEALGDFAIERIDPGVAVLKQLDELLSSLDAIPEHERLHQAIAETCKRAEREQSENGAGRGRDTRRSRAATGP